MKLLRGAEWLGARRTGKERLILLGCLIPVNDQGIARIAGGLPGEVKPPR